MTAVRKKTSILAALLWVAVPGVSVAQSSSETGNLTVPGLSYDCSNVTIDYADDPNLTAQEKLQLMDKLLYTSLSKFDACQDSLEERSENDVEDTEDVSDSENLDGRGESASQSTASSEMSGEEISPTDDNMAQQGETESAMASADVSGDDPPPSQSQNNASGAPTTPEQGGASGGSENLDSGAPNGHPVQIVTNGKIPEDIPNADNDSILEAQIRQAAISETDPETKAKLWNEYRKYKGLPPVK